MANTPATSTTNWRYLERDPTSSRKQLSIKGRGIPARFIYGQYANIEEPRTAEQLAADYDLAVQAIDEAIAYVETNPPEIDEDQRVSDALMEASGMNEPGYRYNAKPKFLTPQEVAEIERWCRA